MALPPYDLFFFGWICLVPLLAALPGTTVREAMGLGLFAGTLSNILSFYWVLALIQNFSNLGPFAYVCVVLMAAYQGIPWALWCGLLRFRAPKMRDPLRAIWSLVMAVLSWVSLEYFYPIIFPYYLANTQHRIPAVTSLVELGGVSLLTTVMLTVNLAVARLLVGEQREDSPTLWPQTGMRRAPALQLLLVTSLVVLTLAWHAGASSRLNKAMARAPKFSIGLVQPNEWIGDRSPLDALATYQNLTKQLVEESQRKATPLDLVLWPESAVRTPHPMIERLLLSGEPRVELAEPFSRYPLDVHRILPSQTPAGASAQVEQSLPWEDRFAVQRATSVPLLFGATLEDQTPGALGPFKGRPPLYNCGVLVDGTGVVAGVAPKVKLLMFGETIPGAGLFPQIYSLLPSSSALLAGQSPKVLSLGSARLGVMICYEDLLPWFHYDLAQGRPQILLNLTNDAWFGKTVEPECHLALATLRAVEGRCYLVRSTPSGVSCVIDPYGQVVASIPSDQAGVLQREVALLDVPTGFKVWGNIVAWMSLAVGLAFGFFWRRNLRS